MAKQARPHVGELLHCAGRRKCPLGLGEQPLRGGEGNGLWFTDREYVYPAWGPLIYYTIYWGFFVYWGVAVMIYAVLRLLGVTF